MGGLSIGMLAFLYAQQIRLPANISIVLTESTTDSIKIYYNIGRGWNEEDSTSTKLSGQKEVVKLGLPLKQIDHYRIDTAAGDARIVMNQLCFESMLRSICWNARELADKMVPFNGVVSYGLVENGLEIVTLGNDPYFAFEGNDTLYHSQVAKPGRLALVVWSIILAGLLYISWLLCQWRGFSIIKSAYRTARERGFAMGIGQASMVFSLLCIVIALSWVGVYELGPWVYLPLIVLVTIIVLVGAGSEFSPMGYLKSILAQLGSQNVSRYEVLLVSLLIILPSVFFLLMTWNQEFPNIGDHEYHRGANKRAYYELRHHYMLLSFLVIGLVISVMVGKIWLYCILAIASLVWVGSSIELHSILYRYPGGGRFISAPLIRLALGEWLSIFNASRLTNFASIVMWLLVLRPLLIGKWPSISILPFALMLFYQAEMVYFFTSVYLEPWALILIALTLELLLVNPGKNAYLKACLLLGMAAIIKEPAIFFVPWFWLAGRPWAKGLTHFKNAVLVGIASILPFIIYYLVRQEHGVSRYKSIGFEYLFSESWWTEMGYRMSFHLGTSGLILMLGVALLWLYFLVKKRHGIDRLSLVCIIGASMTVFFMFNLDFSGHTYTGYFRFYLPMYVLMIAPVLLLSFSTKRRKSSNSFVGLVSLCVVIGHGPKLFDYLSLTFSHDAARNFTEHYDSPVFLPIRALVDKAEKAGALKPGVAEFIHVNHVTGWNQPESGYKDLDRRYDLRMEGQYLCECSDENAVVLAPFVYYTGLNKRLLDPEAETVDQLPREFIKRWDQMRSIRSQCLASLKKTCDFYAQEDVKGEAVGGIGIRY